MTLGFIDLQAFRALWTDGCGYGDPAKLALKNGSVAKAVASWYVRAAEHLASGSRTSLAVPYFEGRTMMLNASRLVCHDNDGYRIHTGPHIMKVTLYKGEGEQCRSGVRTGLRRRLWIAPQADPQAMQSYFSQVVQIADRRCHFWSAIHQLTPAIGLVGAVAILAMAGRRWYLTLGGLALGCGILYLYARSQHTQCAQVSGFWYAASLALAKDKKWCVAEDFREPLDPWALKIGKGFLPRGEDYPQSAQEALALRKSEAAS
jgi:hypothetical protein